MRKIRRAIQRVNVPAILRIPFRAAALFRGDRMPGKIFLQAADDERFGAAVGLGNQVELLLVGNIRRSLQLFAKDGAGFARDFDSRFRSGPD